MRPSRPIAASVLAATLIVSAVACTASEQTPAADSAADSASAAAVAAPAGPAVSIVSPMEGDSVTLPFTVRLEATGVEVVKASGTREEGKGHHHLIINGDVPSDTLPLPPAPIVIHMGDASTERVIDSLPKGPHRIIAVFADGAHVPWTTVKRDTLNIIVK
ncbi:MAG: DUF4399 domain-containing protein [Gemmatimonadaceae bacterium]|nr:DUF4399 domain-containing protein [Gemmatimonadaceae bacterium]